MHSGRLFMFYSGFFHKPFSAFWTCDIYSSLPLWNSERFPAAGAFEELVRLFVLEFDLFLEEHVFYPVPNLHEYSVFT